MLAFSWRRAARQQLSRSAPPLGAALLALALCACDGEPPGDSSAGAGGATNTVGNSAGGTSTGGAVDPAADAHYTTPGLERITNTTSAVPYSLLDGGDYLYQANLELWVDRCEKKPGGKCVELFRTPYENTFSHPALGRFGDLVTFVDSKHLYWYDPTTGKKGELPHWDQPQIYVRTQEQDGLLYVSRGYCEELLVYDHNWTLVAHHYPVEPPAAPMSFNYAPGFLITGGKGFCSTGGFDQVYTIDLDSGESSLYLDFGTNFWGGSLENLFDWDGRVISSCSGPTVSSRILELLGKQSARFLTDAEGPGPYVYSLGRDGDDLWVMADGPTRHELTSGEVSQATLHFQGQKGSVSSGFLDGDYAYLAMDFNLNDPDFVYGGVFRIRKDQLHWVRQTELSSWWPDQSGFNPEEDGPRDWLVE